MGTTVEKNMSLRSTIRDAACLAGVAAGVVGVVVGAKGADPVPVVPVPMAAPVPVVPVVPAIPTPAPVPEFPVTPTPIPAPLEPMVEAPPPVVAPLPAPTPVPLPISPQPVPAPIPAPVPVPVPAPVPVPPVEEKPAVPPMIPPAQTIEVEIEPEILPAPRLVEAPKPTPIAVAPMPRMVPDVPVVSKIVQTSASHPVDAFPTMLSEAKSAYGKVRDYTCHYIRLEKVSSKLVPEQTCELRVRTNPLCVSVRVMAPKDYFGRETVYMANRGHKVKLKEAGKWTYNTLPVSDAKVLADTRHSATDTGLLAVMDRVEKAVAVEKRLNNPVQILVAEYTYAGRDCTRYEIFAERAHNARYAYRHVLYIDKETRLPIRYEAYDQPKMGGPAGGEPIEVQSFVGLKFNTGLGDSTFDR